MSDSGILTEPTKQRTLLIEEIHAAFLVVFPDERLKNVEYEKTSAREIFRIESDKLTRVYMRASDDVSFEDILRNTPHLPQTDQKSLNS